MSEPQRKVKQPDSKIVESLESLKEELASKQENCLVSREILFKINSCLFSEYPPSWRRESS
jgi:hypothetical protein